MSNEARRLPRLAESSRITQDAFNDDMLVSVSNGARSVGGACNGNHPEPFDDLCRSATISRASGNKRSDDS